MKIGLDFDGVIADCGKLKSESAKKLYKVDIPPEKFKIELVVEQNILTLEQYRHLQKQIYETTELGICMEPVRDAFNYIERLQHQGNNLKIVTSRNPSGCAIAQAWLKRHSVSLPICGVGNGIPKTTACQGLDVYVDDDLDKLEPLSNIVRYRFLFSQGYNEHVQTNRTASRVANWRELYCRIRDITMI